MSDPWTPLAIDIAERIAEAGQHDEDGLWWSSNEKVGQRSVGIWGGTAGIALFLLDTFDTTGDERWLNDATQAIDWCVGQLGSIAGVRRGSFLSGGMGVPYLLCRAWDVTRDESYLRRADSLAIELLQSIPKWRTMDLLAGLAGSLLVLLHVESRYPEGNCREIRRDLLIELLSRIRVYRSGVFWDMTSRWRLPLCGMAHGPSGIAFVLIELALRCQLRPNHPLVSLISACFAYEDQFFSSSQRNWPDHRRGKDEAVNFFNAWCHGAAGIGLARLSAPSLGLTDQEPYLTSVLARTRADIATALSSSPDWLSLTLCHGCSGLAEFILSSGHQAESAVVDVAAAARDQFRRLNGILPGHSVPDVEDHSLFLGSAGVGSFLLRVAGGETTPSILRPVVPAHRTLGGLESQNVFDALERALFPRTRRFLGATAHLRSNGGDTEDDGDQVTLPEGTLASMLEDRIRSTASRLDGLQHDQAIDLLRLERTRVLVLQDVEDFTDLTRHWREATIVGPNNFADDARVVLREHVVLHRAKWDWSDFTDSETSTPYGIRRGPYDVLVVPGIEGTSESWLGALGSTLFQRLLIPKSIAELLVNGVDPSAVRRMVSLGLESGILSQVGVGDGR